MALTREQVERWLATLVPGQQALEATVGGMQPTDPFYAYVAKVNEGTKDGIAILRVIAHQLRLAEMAAESAALQQQIAVDLARITPPPP